MKKIAVLVAVLALVALAALPVFARAEKVPLSPTANPIASCENLGSTGTAGFVILNNPQGQHNTMINLQVQSGTPGNYTVHLGYVTDVPSPGKCGGSWQLLGTMSVAPDGTGSFHFNGDTASGTHQFIVALNQGSLTYYASAFIDMTLK